MIKQDSLNELLERYYDKLQSLQKQVSTRGFKTPLDIVREVEDIYNKVSDIEVDCLELRQQRNKIEGRKSVRTRGGGHYYNESFSEDLTKIVMEIYNTVRILENNISSQDVEQIIAKIIKEKNISPIRHVILFCSADPSNEPRLRLMQEARDIHQALRISQLRDKFTFEHELSVTPSHISQALLYYKPMIVHFSGHGTKHGDICFEASNGKRQLVSPTAIAELFKQFSIHVKCILLNSCFSKPTARVIVEHIDYVIGIKNEVSDKAALSFSVGFYQAIGAGKTITEAFNLGKVQVMLHKIADKFLPVLFINQKIK